MINTGEILERLKNMIGSKFDVDEIICAFESENEVIVNKVFGQESNFDGHGLCDCYNSYENKIDNEKFVIYVDCDNEIVHVR